MSFSWAEFNELAQELIGHPGLNATAAAICRTAISRAYYAAFCTAMERLVNVDHVHIDQTADAHVQVYNEFGQSNDVTRRQIAAHLKTLRAQRNTADYDPAPAQVIDTFTAQDSVDLANVVLGILQSL